MRHTTHVLFAIVIITAIYELLPPLKGFIPYPYALLAAMFGSLFPDIDHPHSYISRGYWEFLSRVVTATTEHRGWTHSIFGAVVFTIAAAVVLWYFQGDVRVSLGFMFGYISHLLSDSLNPSGVNWLWPKEDRYGLGIITTGSEGEVVFQKILTFLFAGMLIYDAYDGSLSLLV